MAPAPIHPNPRRFPTAISASGLTIYDPIAIGDPALWIPAPELEQLLSDGLLGMDLAGLPLRTRSKVTKTRVCEVLGYPVPSAFRKTQPRFPGQCFDTYVQKSNNLQVWNEELSPSRRYAIIRVNALDVITRVRVVTGDSLAKLDTTGTLTQKYQARLVLGSSHSELVSPHDTATLRRHVSDRVVLRPGLAPVSPPAAKELLSIGAIYSRLSPLIGQTFRDSGISQERNRGAELHRLVCSELGYTAFQDDGQFPDVRHQLLEVKLQTSSTIDLGLVTPDSTAPLDVPWIGGDVIRHCDVRYALFAAHIQAGTVTITHLVLSTGELFFSRCPRFGGKVLNKKIQIPLPPDFFGM